MKKILLLSFLLSFTLLNSQELDLRIAATGFNSPVAIAHAFDDRMFVVEQGGLIRILQANGTIGQQAFLNISDRISTGGERGLLGLAFPPDYMDSGYFYVNYTNSDGSTQLSRFSVSQNDPNLADPESELQMLTLEQPYANHNGGCLAFGPDGYLYVGLGDGGGSGDPEDRAQDGSSLYGTILRLDVNGELPYSIPQDNPFIDDDTIRDEIWAYGLRNPWKFSFDMNTGDLWIADVGQDMMEEINQIAGSLGGVNYGWRCFEGTLNFNSSNCSDDDDFTFPVAVYEHSQNRASITGGYVYNGEAFPNLQGRYIFADFVSGELAYLDEDNNPVFFGPFEDASFSTFGLNNSGVLYAASLSTGTIYEVVDAEVLSIDKNLQTSVRIFPNPAQNSFSIEFSESYGTNGSLSIFDILGKEVLRKKISSEKTDIDISNLKKGVYLTQFEDHTAQFKNTQKLIVK